MAEQLNLLTVVGNPKVGSRTLELALEVSRQLAAWLESEGRVVNAASIDIAAFSSGLFDWEDAAANGAMAQVKDADLLIVASPVFKATFTGLLKSFLDRAPMEGLDGTVAVPVMVGAAPNHALAVDAYLRPLLVEIGASCPTRALYVTESQLPEAQTKVMDWLDAAKPVLSRALGKG